MKSSKKLQKLFAMLLVAVMVVSVLPFGSLSVFAATGEFAGGDGTEGNPYLIANKTQLNNVRNYLSASFKLITDIEFTDADFQNGGKFYNNGAGFAPIGVDDYSPFNGTFDGDGHVIKNLYVNIESNTYIYVGLFGVNSGTIKNLGMIDGDVSATSSDSAQVGGLVGLNENGTIENCYNTGSVSATTTTFSEYTKTRAGGIVGSSGGTEIGNVTAKIDNCYNTGNVGAFSYGNVQSGGISGYNNGTITNSYNAGYVLSFSIETTNEMACFTGGIVGYNYTGPVTNCYNIGNTVASSDYAYTYAGGIQGYNYEGTVLNCYNTGGVSANSDYAYALAGGIASYSDGIIRRCYNTGSVSTYAITQTDSSYSAESGGIIAENWGTIEYCYNTGSVLAEAAVSSTAYSSYAYAGGIAAYNGVVISSCYNEGSVSAESAHGYDCDLVGGIAGMNDATIINCYNAGDVSVYSVATIDDVYLGGIVGLNWGAITNCYNIGNESVNASTFYSYEGGIAGDNEGTMTNCYYSFYSSLGTGYGTDTAIKCSLAQLQRQSTFVGFDFETVWTIESNSDYPYPILKSMPTVEISGITSNKYTIEGNYIFGVGTETKVSDFLANLNEGEYCKVYKDGVELGNNEFVGTDMTVKLIEDGIVKATYTVVVLGDINGSGKVDSADYLLIKRAAFGTFTLTEAMKLAGDINSDNLINSADYLLVKRACFGTYKI